MKPANVGTGASLLAAIFESPDDDAPRRVYADWLMDHGDARGDFIGEQLDSPGGPREEALLRTHGATWRAELPDLLGVRWGDFRRGFVEAVAVNDVAAVLKHPRRPFAPARVRPVCALQAKNGDDGEARAAGVAARARSSDLARLATLDLMSSALGPADVAALAGSRHVAGLRELVLADNELGTHAMHALAG